MPWFQPALVQFWAASWIGTPTALDGHGQEKGRQLCLCVRNVWSLWRASDLHPELLPEFVGFKCSTQGLPRCCFLKLHAMNHETTGQNQHQEFNVQKRFPLLPGHEHGPTNAARCVSRPDSPSVDGFQVAMSFNAGTSNMFGGRRSANGSPVKEAYACGFPSKSGHTSHRL